MHEAMVSGGSVEGGAHDVRVTPSLQLAADIQGAADEIKWPMPQSDFDKVDARKIHSALFQYMYGARVDRLAAVFKRHGYSIHDNNSQRT